MLATLSTPTINVADGNQVLDQTGLMARIKGDMTFLRIIFEAFRAQYPDQRGEMKSAFAANDFTKVRTVAHSLKGNASTLGGQRIATTAANIMATCAEASPTNLPSLFRRLDTEVGQFHQAMTALLGY